jgi:hypothetical protein
MITVKQIQESINSLDINETLRLFEQYQKETYQYDKLLESELKSFQESIERIVIGKTILEPFVLQESNMKDLQVAKRASDKIEAIIELIENRDKNKVKLNVDNYKQIVNLYLEDIQKSINDNIETLGEEFIDAKIEIQNLFTYITGKLKGVKYE